MLKIKLTTLLAAIFVATECLAWGQVGHDTTCSIAEKHLSKKAKKRIAKVFDGKSIIYWSNWLDNASHHAEYAYTSTWHYKNIEEGQDYDDVQPFKTGDIITALNEQITRLKSHTLSKDEEALALKMFIHFMGDLHQPMHFGRLSDTGGNKVQVRFFDYGTNLHHVWDEDLVEKGHRWTYDEWTAQLDRLSKDEIRQLCTGTLDDWAKESYEYAKKIYAATPSGTKISYDYVAEWTPLVEQQFVKGGIRLAHILNEIYR